eukprot:m.238293 g.238293  ORF g.238293 m.238293 type:complete len:549 (-) comp16059_c0_seq12:708-2354(-)
MTMRHFIRIYYRLCKLSLLCYSSYHIGSDEWVNSYGKSLETAPPTAPYPVHMLHKFNLLSTTVFGEGACGQNRLKRGLRDTVRRGVSSILPSSTQTQSSFVGFVANISLTYSGNKRYFDGNFARHVCNRLQWKNNQYVRAMRKGLQSLFPGQNSLDKGTISCEQAVHDECAGSEATTNNTVTITYTQRDTTLVFPTAKEDDLLPVMQEALPVNLRDFTVCNVDYSGFIEVQSSIAAPAELSAIEESALVLTEAGALGVLRDCLGIAKVTAVHTSLTKDKGISSWDDLAIPDKTCPVNSKKCSAYNEYRKGSQTTGSTITNPFATTGEPLEEEIPGTGVSGSQSAFIGMIAGIAFLVVAVAILVVLLVRRRSQGSTNDPKHKALMKNPSLIDTDALDWDLIGSSDFRNGRSPPSQLSNGSSAEPNRARHSVPVIKNFPVISGVMGPKAPNTPSELWDWGNRFHADSTIGDIEGMDEENDTFSPQNPLRVFENDTSEVSSNTQVCCCNARKHRIVIRAFLPSIGPFSARLHCKKQSSAIQSKHVHRHGQD